MQPLEPRVAVVGHVEWVEFARVASVPRPGDVVHAVDCFEEPAGGGAVAAVQLARLAGSATLYTALGDDQLGHRAAARLAELGVTVHAQLLQSPTRRALTLIDDRGERTITTLGPRLDPLGSGGDGAWADLRELDGVYFTAGDIAALRLARAGTRVLTASPRARQALGHGIRLDALVLSAGDEAEREAAQAVAAEAGMLVMTEGSRGGRYRDHDGEGRWEAAPVSRRRGDAYGCGDSFAAGLTFGLASGLETPAALELAARCGAACLTGRGPYAGMAGAEALSGRGC